MFGSLLSKALGRVCIPLAHGMFDALLLSLLALANPDALVFVRPPTADVHVVACHLA